MPDYSSGKIYTIRSHVTDNLYVGSTTQPLYKRLGDHRADFKAYLGGSKKYYTSFEMIKLSDHYIELVENFPCDSKEQLCKREGEVIRETPNCVNKNIAGRTKKEYGKEYRRKNSDKLRKQKKEYYQDNIDKILQDKKEYYQENKENLSEKIPCDHCGIPARRGDIVRHQKSTRCTTNAWLSE